ncbi:hypothetical protein CCR75_000264 [Bremia lactucae]|uniref:Cytochrome P450 n=1 Tax=Bremia lactucae TaxID=4779 RepID=A0A976FED3_BRELC|nr:hypothetical protein CCR75_000264 [Bremia lactucae]
MPWDACRLFEALMLVNLNQSAGLIRSRFSTLLGGPRIFLGRKFALAEVNITLAKLLSRFDFQTVKSPFEFSYQSSISLQIKGPLDVVVTRL